MDPEKIKAALDAIEKGDEGAALAILKEMIAAAAGGGAPPVEEAAADDPAEPNADAPPPDEMAALGRLVIAATGRKSPGEAIEVLNGLVAQVNQLAADRAALESAERRDLVTRLVTCGAETPATAWQRDDKGAVPAGDARKPVKRLSEEPIAELRERVKLIEATRPRNKPAVDGGHAPPTAPAVEDGQVFKTSRGEITLSAREIRNCKSQGADVAAYAENKAIREAARNKH